LPRYSTIFLDADGTLFDFDAAEAGALEAALRVTAGWYDAERCLGAYRAISRELWQELERGRTTQAELAVERFRRLAEGRRLALVTNGLSRVQRRRIEASPIAGFFGAVVISDEVGLAKPDPAILALTCRLLGLGTDRATKDRMLMVGDSLPADIACGAAFGVATCLYDPAGCPSPAAGAPESPVPTHRIRSLPELIDIVG
jgi:2-haloacid dehalogenase